MEYLRPQQETAVHIGEFTVYYRTLPLRVKIEKQYFHNGKSFTLKCEATFGRHTHLTRAKSARVFIVSTDDLTNQKLVNSKSAAAATGNQINAIFIQQPVLVQLKYAFVLITMLLFFFPSLFIVFVSDFRFVYIFLLLQWCCCGCVSFNFNWSIRSSIVELLPIESFERQTSCHTNVFI